ncbi:hypothetical protein EJ06DRAFT_482129 [Trichodelitschia bisporula]|uniref:Ubiquitin-conjugating enzyme E2-binding protein n=1 Tax=Trichodelitschia bisporula TaxID=703511 RepID=A0A6G1HNT3_9PEZI|nr:hypothetical protein EJ06DRAFT_482129 [Trichodelitschia bisporula]
MADEKPDPITLYAELLTNLRTCTFFASLNTDSNAETRATMASDGQTVTVTHEGQEATMRLPMTMGGGGEAALMLPANPSKELTMRLVLTERETGLICFDETSEDLVPWGADRVKGRVVCRCGRELVQGVQEWRDLPREGWAEMMDFWHCHKPHEEGDHKDVAAKKGYGASRGVTALESIGLVGLTYFVVSEQDCTGIKASRFFHSHDGRARLRCEKCDSVVGVVDKLAEGWRLYKWAVGVKTGDEVETFKVQKWVTALLGAGIENSGGRRFVVEDEDEGGEKGALLLWVFTDDLAFSSSVGHTERQDPTRAMKIFWKRIPNPKQLLEEHHFQYEHLPLPTNVYTDIEATLERSADMLPQSARKFQDWDVGMLEKFGNRDLGFESVEDGSVEEATGQMSGLNMGEMEAMETAAEREVKMVEGGEGLLE